MTSSAVTAVDDGSFEQLVLRSELPVLLKFEAKGCPPCRVLSPIVERVAAEVAGRCRVFSVDIDDARQVAARYGIRMVPTLLAFAGGAPRGQLVGVAKREAVLKLIG